MVKAAIPFVATEDSMAPTDRQIVFASAHTRQMEEMKRSFSIQNNLLARRNEELQMRVTDLEKQLFLAQKQVLALRNEKVQLNEKMKLNSKRFNDIIVDSLDKLMSEYRNFMADVGVEVNKKNVPLHLSQKVSDEQPFHKATDFVDYWKNINDGYGRRKSLLFNFKSNSSAKDNTDLVPTRHPYEGPMEDDQLDTLVEKEEEEEGEEKKEEESPLEPEYEDERSVNIPIKRQSIVMEKMENLQLGNIPFLGVSETCNEQRKGPLLVTEVANNDNDDLFNRLSDSPSSPASPVKKSCPSELNIDQDEGTKALFIDNNKHPEYKEMQVSKERKIVRKRKNKIPRELRNLDTEKTKKWLGMDPLDDVEESTSERRKSRRRSLVVNYQLPSLKHKMRRSSGHFSDAVYIDQDKENRVRKPKSSLSRNILKNITNTSLSAKRDSFGKNDRESSIFDLENADIFGDYNKHVSIGNKDRDLNGAYDMLL